MADNPYPRSPLDGTPATGAYPPSNVDISKAIISHESGGKNVVSPQGATGPGQLMPGTFAQYAKPGERIDNPADNIAVHHRIIADYQRRWPGDPARVAVAYFSGPGNVAPPGSPTPWIHNYSDVNESVAKYVSSTAGNATPATPATSATPATPGKTSFAEAAQKGDVGAMLKALTAEDDKGKSPLGSLADSVGGGGNARGGGQAAAASTPMAMPAPMGDYAGPAGQLMAQATQLASKPLAWSAAPFGAGAGMVPGTTLNS